MRAGELDHFGISVPSKERYDETLENARRFRDKDPRVEIRENENHYDALALHSFYVRHLLPIWVEVHRLKDRPKWTLDRAISVRNASQMAPDIGEDCELTQPCHALTATISAADQRLSRSIATGWRTSWSLASRTRVEGLQRRPIS